MRQSPHAHSASLLVSHRSLLLRVARSDLKARYAGSILGIGWALLTPLIMLGIYATVYLVIFKVQIPGLSPLGYILFIFSGLVPFLMTSEALAGGVGSIVANKSVLSNTVFPIDLAPAKAVLLSQIPMVVGYAVIIFVLTVTGSLRWPICFLPLVWGLHALALIGLTWILSLVQLVFRDLQNMVTLILMALMVISPIAYTPDMVPRELRTLLAFNPLGHFIVVYQHISVLGDLPPARECLIMAVFSIGVFVLGGFFFSRAKSVMIDYV